MNERLEIGVIGIGAIGSVLSLALHDNQDIAYFNRSPRHNIHVEYQGDPMLKEIRLTNFGESIDFDWLIVCLKEYHFDEAMPAMVKLLHPNTKVAIVRNGMYLKDPFLPYLPEENLLECIIDCPTQLAADGAYQQLRKAKITTAKNNNIIEFKNLFQIDKINITVVDDLHTEKWKKVIESSALGGILTIFNNTCEIFADAQILELYKKVLGEGIAVAKADGAKLPATFAREMMDKLLAYPAGKGSSMLTDRRNGRAIEWRAKNGIISSTGKKYNICTDLNDLICLLLKRINS